jgi:tetratricopeptide (TPR) repeat protein
VKIRPQNIVSRYVERRILLSSLVLLGLAFLVTAALARSYHVREEGLAAEWFLKGNSDFTEGKREQAFEDFQNSLSYNPENSNVQLRLAEALLEDGRYAEAHSYLANLWDRTPGSGQVNLDLAHVFMQSGDVGQAVRYFHGAIFGSWESEPVEQRRKARLELIDFLLAHRLTTDAQAEIAGLATDTPSDDGILREENGRLLLKAGEPGKALAEFEAALKTNPHQSAWLADAGEVAFEDGDYLKAESYFSKSDRESPEPEVHVSLLLVRGILGNDPYLAGLSDEEQARRTWGNFQHELERLRNCTGRSPDKSRLPEPPVAVQPLAKEAQEFQRRVRLASLEKDSDLRNDTMRLVYRIEDAASQSCGPGTSLDEALQQIEKRHEGSNP